MDGGAPAPVNSQGSILHFCIVCTHCAVCKKAFRMVSDGSPLLPINILTNIIRDNHSWSSQDES